MKMAPSTNKNGFRLDYKNKLFQDEYKYIPVE